jgi:hypothetical protein
MNEENVKPLFATQQPKDPGQSGVKMLEMVIEIASARMLALIAVLGGVAVWGYAVLDPSILRLYAGAGFSLGILLPLVVLYYRKG